MADLGLLTAKINSLPQNLRAPMLEIVTILTKDMRFGHPKQEQPDPALNFGGGFFAGTTAAIADDEFTIAHGFGRVPYLAIPVLPLDTENAEIVPLMVTRAADDKRLYFSSSVQSAPVLLYIEG